MFMQIHHPTTLTADDHAVLERLMCTFSGSQEPIAALLRRKLETAVIVHPDASSDDLVTSNRRVRYSVNGAQETEHLLTWDKPEAADATALSLQKPRGLALLGLRKGQSISFPAETGIETATITGVYPVPGRRAGAALTPSSILAAKLQGIAATIKREARATMAGLQKGRTETVLMRLSDATLSDIGITRGEISHVAGIVAGVTPTDAEATTGRPGGPGLRRRRVGNQAMIYPRATDNTGNKMAGVADDRQGERA
jgi:regulator of nucleoside diphosphate kinase